MADHLDALCFPAAQRSRGPCQVQVSQSDGHESFQQPSQAINQQLGGGKTQPAHPIHQIGDLHLTSIGD